MSLFQIRTATSALMKMQKYPVLIKSLEGTPSRALAETPNEQISNQLVVAPIPHTLQRTQLRI